MNQSKIEWCDRTWNPITGCLHDCPYCYARGIARRFGEKRITGDCVPDMPHIKQVNNGKCFELTEPCKTPYPFGFSPTLHRYRLDEPQRIKKPQTIFVGSMADVFGEWVPDAWIEAVFEACAAAPQHRYLFLTKNPARYIELAEKGLLPDALNFWFGSTATTQADMFWWSNLHNSFVSIEPLLGEFQLIDYPTKKVDWVIIGAETGNRRDKIVPERAWVENIVTACREVGIPVFMKSNLADVWGEPLVQEFPWEAQA